MKIMTFIRALLYLFVAIAACILVLEVNFAIQHGYLLPIEKVADLASLF